MSPFIHSLALALSVAASEPVAPEGFQVHAALEPGSLQAPRALALDGRGRLYVLEADGAEHSRVELFVDDDLDGRFESKRTLLEKVPGATRLAVGYGHLWIARSDALVLHALGEDGQPGPAQIAVSSERTGAAPRALEFGPDGWLYVAGGSYAPDSAAIWRVHPVELSVQPFATGPATLSALAFGPDGHLFGFDPQRPALHHVVRNARLGPADDWPLQALELERGADSAPAGATFDLGGAVPVELQGQLLLCDPAAGRVQALQLEPAGSGRSAATGSARLQGTPGSFEPIALTPAPDGSLLVLDAGGGQAPGLWRVSYGPPEARAVDLTSLKDSELVALVLDRNEWWVRRSLLELAHRQARGETHAWLLSILRHNRDAGRRVRALRLLAACEGLDETVQLSILRDRHTLVQAFGVRLVLDAGAPEERFAASFVGLAARTRSLEVRLQLAAALSEVPEEVAWTLAAQLIGRADDAQDPNLPSLLAHGVVRLVPGDAGRALGLLRVARIPLVVEALVRELARDPGQHEALVQHLVLETDTQRELAGLRGMLAGTASLEDLPRPLSWAVLANGFQGSSQSERAELFARLSARFTGS